MIILILHTFVYYLLFHLLGCVFMIYVYFSYIAAPMLARKIYFSLSPSMRRVARRLFYLPIDVLEKLTGNKPPMTPPRGMIFTGSGDFIKSGKALMELCIQHTGLQPEGAILDIGCGIGRLAVPLTGYLTHKGRYEGFDVVEDGINWCTKNIHTTFPNFTFTHTPLRNDLYNLSTEQQAQSFVFPYPNNSFDAVVLTSVFTHMQYAEVQHYLKEIKRVLKPEGKCLATFFVLDETTAHQIKGKPNVMQFDYEYDRYYLHDAKVKDANIAFKHEALLHMANEAQLQITLMNQGWWKGTPKETSLNFQDVVVFKPH